MFVAVAIILVAAVVIVVAVAWPLLARPSGAAETLDARARRRQRLEEDLEVVLSSIREIEQDHRSGALSDEDFETLDRDERQRAVELMRRLDALEAREAPKATDDEA